MIVGCDPGKDGAVVLLNAETQKVVKMFRVPKLEGHKKTTEPDWGEFDNIFKKYMKRIDHVFCEKPTTGGAFAGRTQSMEFGGAIKAFEQTLKCNGIRFTMVPPSKWQKEMFEGIPIVSHPKKETKEEKEKRKKLKKNKPAPKVKDNKAMALEATRRLFPKTTFIPEGCRVAFDGWTDAALIGLYGIWKINGKGE